MSWSAVTDLINQAGVNAFGETITYKPASGSTYSIKGVFNRQSVEESAGQSAPVSGMVTTCGVRAADLAADPVAGDQIIFNATTYNIVNAENDGGGGILLVLQAD